MQIHKVLGPLALVALAAPLIAAAGQETDRQRRRSPVVEVFEQCRDAVVNVSTARLIRYRSLGPPSIFEDIFDFGRPRQRIGRVESVGSGVVVHERGYILTNAHVVAQTSDIQITFADKRTLPAEVIAVDHEHDLAVLHVDAGGPLKHIQLGRSDDIMIGETVVAIGNPLGLQHTVTAGIVSALDRELQYGRERTYTGLIQTDAAINPGNSGGPLLNVNSELIGINTAIRGDAQNVGFAIPVDRVWELLPDMLNIERRQRVRFGLRVAGAEPTVQAVAADSPAARAGLKRGDRLIRFGDEPLSSGIDYYVRLLDRKPGDEIQLTIRRGASTQTVTVPLEAVPIPDGAELAARLMGVRLAEIPERIRRRLELPEYVTLVIDSVSPRGPAGREGIESGDILLRINRLTVKSLQDVGLILESVTPGDRVLLEGLRLQNDGLYFWTAIVRVQ